MQEHFDHSWRGRLGRYAPLILWIGVIFFLSSSNGSSGVTSRFVAPIFHFFFPNGSDESLQLLHFYVRKGAHLTVYAILAFLAAACFLTSPASWVRKTWAVAVIGTVMAVASLDEFNQSFNPLRTGVPTDVLIDLAGGLGATAFVQILRGRRKKEQ